MEFGTLYLGLAVVFGLFMAWGIGANDVANAMGTSVGSGAIRFRQAIIIAAVFEMAGAILAGGEVTRTIRKDIVDVSSLSGTPELLVYGMLSSLLAAAIWLLLATRRGWPVSTTHSIIGAMVGFSIAGIGVDAVNWGKVGTITLSWIVSPVFAGTIAYALFSSVQWLVIDTPDPVAKARKYVPGYIFLVGFVISMVTLVKGLKHVGLELSVMQSVVIAIGIGVGIAVVGAWLIHRLTPGTGDDPDVHHVSMEQIFAILMVFTAIGMAFAHGSNDVANAIGPVAAVIGIVQSGGDIAVHSATPIWVLLLGGVGIVIGLATFGHRVMATIGRGITELTPSRGFAAELGAASTLVLASGTGLPISATQTLVGAVLGVGFARGIGALRLDVVRTIFLSWAVTLPAGAVLSITFFFLFQLVLG